MSTEQITEAINLYTNKAFVVLEVSPELRVLVEAAQDHLTCLRNLESDHPNPSFNPENGNWVTCPVCECGNPDLCNLPQPHNHYEDCPDCVDGMVPSSNAVMRVAGALADQDTVLVEDAPDIYLPLARRVLLASRQGDTR